MRIPKTQCISAYGIVGPDVERLIQDMSRSMSLSKVHDQLIRSHCWRKVRMMGPEYVEQNREFWIQEISVNIEKRIEIFNRELQLRYL